MKTFITSIITFLIIALTFTACFPDRQPSSSSTMTIPTHTVVALDLSDRIHNQETATRDILVIEQLFGEFLAKCREEMFVDCQSSFSVVLIPQRGGERLLPLVDSLSIDLGQIGDMKKRETVEAFAAMLDRRLQALYGAARMPALTDYDGSCMFRFLNNILPPRLDCHLGERTQLCLITDGLVEVDSQETRIEMNGRRNYISEAQMNNLRKDNAWQAADLHLLVVPTNLAKRDNTLLAVTLIGLQPRADYALEQDLLTAIWGNWMEEIRVPRFATVSYDAERSFVLAEVLKKTQ